MIRRTWDLILLVVLILLTIFVTWLFINLMKGNDVNIGFKSNESITEVYDNTFENIFDEINIDSVASNIYIKNSYDNVIRVNIKGNEAEFNVAEYGNKLNIETSTKRCKIFCFHKRISSVTLYVPTSYSEKININNNYGDVEIGNLAYANIEVSEDAGDVDITSVNNIKVESKLGDIKINSVNSSLILVNNLGDIKVSNANLLMDSYIENNMGDIKIGNTNDLNIDADTNLGDVKINKNHRESRIRLRIKNDLGDIKINN